MKKVLLGLLSCSVLSSVYAMDNTCAQYMSKPVQGKDFNFYYQKVNSLKIPKKDEFETTAQYKERLDKAFQSLNIPSEFFIEIPIEQKYITFDADTKLLTFSPYVINNANVYYGYNFKDLLEPANKYFSDAYDVQISRDVKEQGFYTAQNGFGANFQIKKQEVTYKSIFDQPKQGFSLSNKPPLGIFNIDENNISIDKVKALKSKSKAYAFVSLKPPYIAKISSPPERVTATGRVDSTTINEVLFADIQCFIITDENNNGVISSVLDTKLGDEFVKQEEIRLRKKR
jgi:hypothetical protein